MKKTSRFGWILILTAGLGVFARAAAEEETPARGIFPAVAPGEVGVPSEVLDTLSEMIETWVRLDEIVGAELLVVKDRRTVLHAAFGRKDAVTGAPMEKDTIFNIRSMTKPIVGAAVQVLVDEGKLSLDDPVAKFLPSFDNEKSRRITVRHLLTHRSGLPDGHPPGRPEDYGSLRAVADYWGGHGPTEFAPGSGFAYSDPGSDVAGAVVEAVSGRPLDEFVRARILETIGMRDTFALRSADDPRSARIGSDHRQSQGTWQRYWKPGDPPLAPFVIGSGTTWYATPMDYARFLAVWMDEGRVGDRRVLSEAAVRRALEPVSLMPYMSGLGGTTVKYGQMWQVYVAAEGKGKERLVVFGHSGSDGTYAWAWPDRDLMVLYFTQSRGQMTRILLEAALTRWLSK